MSRKIKLFFLIVVAVVIDFTNAVDYCNIKSCGARQTACLYPKDGPSSKCTGYQGSGLSASEKQKILNLHNQLRQKVASGNEYRGKPGPQPAAKSMPNLQWDNEIAYIAQRWADQCTFAHDSCRSVGRFSVGQNIGDEVITSSLNNLNVEDIIQLWYDEVEKFDKNDVANFSGTSDNGKQVGDYTQLVWAKTTHIGCGATKYKDGPFNLFYLVCNYGPAGNLKNEPVYQAV